VKTYYERPFGTTVPILPFTNVWYL